MYFVIHKRGSHSASISDTNKRGYRSFIKLSNGILIYKIVKVTSNRNFFYDCWVARMIDSLIIIRAEISQKGVKKLLRIAEYITESIVIHYEGFELKPLSNYRTFSSFCVSYWLYQLIHRKIKIISLTITVARTTLLSGY